MSRIARSAGQATRTSPATTSCLPVAARSTACTAASTASASGASASAASVGTSPRVVRWNRLRPRSASSTSSRRDTVTGSMPSARPAAVAVPWRVPASNTPRSFQFIDLHSWREVLVRWLDHLVATEFLAADGWTVHVGTVRTPRARRSPADG